MRSMNSIIDYMEHWAAVQPDKHFSSFLNVHGEEKEAYTYASFQERSRHLAEYLAREVGLKHGDRALLVYPPGLEIIVAFVACARIGVIPVPVYPPTPVNLERGLATLTFVARDCGARVALTNRDLLKSYPQFGEERRDSILVQNTPALPNLDWFTTDDVRGQASGQFTNDPGPILFLQYTSGSTSDPKGVIVSHENVIHNCRVTVDHVPTAVCWLPQYHDMGLIGYYVYLVITGGTTYGFSPTDFLKRPALWLQTMSRVRATYASAPNFGFEYCLRETKIPDEALRDVDLSSVRVLMSGAEPVHADTYRRFLRRFGAYGLRPEAHVVAYGLAENTLAVTSYGRRTVTVNKRSLQESRLHVEKERPAGDDQATLVSCGRPLEGIHVRIVDAASRTVLDSGQIGEIWVAGHSTSQGYWNRPELTREVFHNTLNGDGGDDHLYLRTGDLGFLEGGELFVCGRLKDVIIVRGVNYYPQDIERIVESASPKIKSGQVAAFSGNGKEETVIIVVGVRKAGDLPDPREISQVLRTRYYPGPHTIVFCSPRIIAKTTSGKLARSTIRRRWLSGEVPAIATFTSGDGEEGPSRLPAGRGGRIQQLLASYHLTGQEAYTLAEAGIDSLGMATLVLDIEQMLEEHAIPKSENVIDGRILQRLTVAELSSLLDQLERGTDEQVAALQGVVRRLSEEHDALEAATMRRDASLGPLPCTELCQSDDPIRGVLLTGPTGFFGPFLLASLLRQTPYTYYVLTRAADPASGLERVRSGLRRAGLWTPAVEADLAERVQVLCGDVAQHNLGLHADVWQSLAGQVQAVVHNAAMVHYVLDYSAHRPHNVDGTRELLRFSCTGAAKEFHLISSTIIFGWTSEGELLESECNAEMSNLDLGYAQTKWVAEQLVFAAEKQGLPVRVYRPSFLSASSGGVGSRDDIVVRLLGFMINHGLAVNARNQISFVPADVAADNIAALIGQRPIAGPTFHVTVDDYYSLPDITRLITDEYGYRFDYYDIPAFVAEITRRCPKEDPLYPLLGFFNQSHPKIAAMQDKRYGNERYRAARQLTGNLFPDPTLRQTVSYLMSYMLGEGIIRPHESERS